MATTQECGICCGRGFIIDTNRVQKKCVCQVKRELELYLKPLLPYPLVKSTDFTHFPQHALITGGEDRGWGSLVKSYLFKRYFQHHNPRERYALTTGIAIMEEYLGASPTQAPTKHTHFYHTPLLFLDLTRFYTNRAMGEIIRYTLEQRAASHLIDWVYVGHLGKDRIDDIYNGGLKDYLLLLDKINIDEYTKNLDE